MITQGSLGSSRWRDAVDAASLFSVDPAGMGLSLRAGAGPMRDRCLTLLTGLLPAGAAIRRLPGHAGDSRLLGGLDLAATLRAGRPVSDRGLLAEADGGIVVIPMAERLSARTAATLAGVLDDGVVVMERDGMALRTPTRIGLIALDEGLDEDERPPAALLDRFAFRLDLDGIRDRDADGIDVSRTDIMQARAALPLVRAPDHVVEAFCAASLALGISSVRAVLLALRVSRAAAALAGRNIVSDDDAALAARLVLSHRATIVPMTQTLPEETEPQSSGQARDAPAASSDAHDEPGMTGRPLDDIVIQAAKAAIPEDLLARLVPSSGARGKGHSGRSGAPLKSILRGRPVGARRGAVGRGARLDLIETLRAAAPWQRLRRAEGGLAEGGSAGDDARPLVVVRRDDFRIRRFKARAQTTIIFVVDASGSSALNRLAEAKGAVELVLAECYVRRDQVALIVFRGKTAEIVLPPTGSLVRAKRSLAGVPGGGGTPIAAGIDAAAALADAEARKGRTPIVILVTDGKANVAHDGSADRPLAEEEARIAARGLRAAAIDCLLVDIAPRPERLARNLALELRARYLALPYADAPSISQAVQAVATARAR